MVGSTLTKKKKNGRFYKVDVSGCYYFSSRQTLILINIPLGSNSVISIGPAKADDHFVFLNKYEAYPLNLSQSGYDICFFFKQWVRYSYLLWTYDAHVTLFPNQTFKLQVKRAQMYTIVTSLETHEPLCRKELSKVRYIRKRYLCRFKTINCIYEL